MPISSASLSQTKNPITPLQSSVIGAAAGLTGSAPLHPLNTLFSRQQTTGKSLRETMRSIRSPQQAFQGLAAGSVAVVGQNICRFWGFEWADRHLPHTMTGVTRLTCQAAIAGAMESTLPWAFEAQKTRQQHHFSTLKPLSLSPTTLSLSHFQKHLFPGFQANLLKNISARICWFGLSDSLRSKLPESVKTHPLSHFGTTFAGAALAQPVVIPLQVMSYQKIISPHHSYGTLFFNTLKEQGLQGLYRGWCPKTLYIGLSAALTVGSYGVYKDTVMSRNNSLY